MSNMSDDELVQQILAQARSDMAARQAATRTLRAEREQPWLYAFLAMAAVLLTGIALLPGGLADKLELVVHGVCAQAHHITIAGVNMPLCARNTGIYSGFLATVIYLLALGRGRAAKLPPLPITLALLGFVLLMAVDGFNSLFLDIGAGTLYEPRNELRVITGLGMGVAVGVFLLFAFNSSMLLNQDREQPVMSSWLELAGALLINALFFVIFYGLVPPAWAYYPLAIFSVVGILGVLFGVNVLVLSVVSGREGTYSRLRQMARPGTIALALTAVELGLLAAARISIEGGLGIRG